jgi:hypothetical protein
MVSHFLPVEQMQLFGITRTVICVLEPMTPNAAGWIVRDAFWLVRLVTLATGCFKLRGMQELLLVFLKLH